MECSDLIASAGILLTAGSFLYTWRTKKKLNAQMECINSYQIKKNEEEEVEKKKAFICAKAYRKSDSHGLIIANTGKSIARDVVFESEELDNDPSVNLYNTHKLLPINLMSRQEVVIPARFEKGGVQFQIRLKWNDDFSENREVNQSLPIPY